MAVNSRSADWTFRRAGVAGSGRTCLPSSAGGLADRSVLIATRDQVTAVLALIELDGVARRLTLCPPEVDSSPFSRRNRGAGDADAIVTDIDSSLERGSTIFWRRGRRPLSSLSSPRRRTATRSGCC
jgi:hypothetical protein